MKKETPFRFKQFEIHHDRCTMKVGTDAVLLGSWVDVTKSKTILDVGTGSGIIALMLAQRTDSDVVIDALEIETEETLQAKENVARSPWSNKVSVYEVSLQEFDPGKKYDLIVSNPPYFVNSLLPPSHHRARARHTEQLTFDELLFHSIRLLNPAGTLAVVMPVPEGNNFKQLSLKKGLHLKRQLAFYSRKEKPQERWLFEFGVEGFLAVEEKLVLYNEGHKKTDAYFDLTRDFYL